MSKEEKLFGIFKEAFDGYAPETPAHIYAGIEKNIAKKSFWSWSWNSLNVWYLALVLSGAAIAWSGMSSPGENIARNASTADVVLTSPVLKKAHASIDLESSSDIIDLEESPVHATYISSSKPNPNLITQKSMSLDPESDKSTEGSEVLDSSNDSTANTESSDIDSKTDSKSEGDTEESAPVWKFKTKKTVDPDDKK